MGKFSFLTNYSIKEESDIPIEKHRLYPIDEHRIINAQERMLMNFPKDLNDFYKEIGYGFFNRDSDGAINRLMDPESVADIRLRK